MHRIHRHLTYANVMATLAVFIVLGGGAYAAFHLPRNSVRSKNIVNGQVKGADVKEASLGEVPRAADAQTVGGIPPSEIGGIGRSNPGTSGSCFDDEEDGTFCGSVSLSLPRPARVLLTVTGEVSVLEGESFDDAFGTGSGSDDPNLVAGECEFADDNGFLFPPGLAGRAWDTGLRNTEFAPGNFSRTVVGGPISAGPHFFNVRCIEHDGPIAWNEVFISAVMVGTA